MLPQDELKKILTKRHELGDWEYPALTNDEMTQISAIQNVIQS